MLDDAPPVIVTAVEDDDRGSAPLGSMERERAYASATAIHRLARHWPAARVCNFANRLGACIASRPGATPAWRLATYKEWKCGRRALPRHNGYFCSKGF